jgi:hypothetical protein
MTIRSGLIVLIRCFAVLGLFQALLYGIGLSSIRNSDFTVAVDLLIFGVLGSVFLLLVLLYLFAGAVVDRMTPKSNELYAETGVKPQDLQAIAFSTLGAYILYLALRDTIGTLTVLRGMPNLNFDLARLVLIPLVSWIIGIYLLIGAPAVRRWIGRMRRAGQDTE